MRTREGVRYHPLIVLGIDFGTSTTEVAGCRDGRVEMLRHPDGDEVIPSVVAFLPTGKAVVGKAAVERQSIDPKNTIQSVKRILGLGWFDQAVADYRDSWAYEMKEDARGRPVFVTRQGTLSPGQIAARQLEVVRTRYLGVDDISCGNVVVTVPPAFEASQKMAMIAAAQDAGFARVGLIDEPYAAALPYLRGEAIDGERIVAVYDLGGGTFDVALLRFRGITHRVLGFGGDAQIGGNDIDRTLAEWMAEQVLSQYQWDMRTSKEVFHKLMHVAEQAKIHLSRSERVEVDLGTVDPVLSGKKLAVNREQVRGAIYQLLQGTFLVCDQVLAEAGMMPRQVDQVILAGGSTYLPMVRDAVRQYFGREPISDLPPDRIVAIGAGISAALQAGDRRVLSVG